MKKYTYSAKRSDKVDKWYIVDAEGVVLGRLATVVAFRLGGKHNPLFTPHVDEDFFSKSQATAAIGGVRHDSSMNPGFVCQNT